MDTTVTVVIPTYNRIERLKMVLGALARQTYPNESTEVVVVSDGSDDGTDEYLTSGQSPIPVIVITQRNGGPAVARNNGVDRASGDLIVFIDDDVVADPDLVRQHVASHARATGPTVVIGPMLTPPGHELKPWVRWEQDMLYKQYDAMRAGKWAATPRQLYTGNASVPRHCLLEVGGFDTSLRRAEDVELGFRLEDHGLLFDFNHDAKGLHYADRPFASWLSTAEAYGHHDARMAMSPGRAWFLDAARREFRHGNLLRRVIVTTCVNHRRLGRAASTALRWISAQHERLHWWRLTRAALSALYAIAYYRALVDEFGSWEAFYGTRTANTPAANTPGANTPTSTDHPARLA